MRWQALVLIAATGLARTAQGQVVPEAAITLSQAGERYRAAAAQGGWPAIMSGPSIAPGMRDARLPVLRRRLMAEGYTTEAALDPEVYDSGLVSQVQRFQALHGLEPDGIVGPNTRAALNVPAAQRARQIGYNLARFRAAPPAPPRFILVNSAAFALAVVEGGTHLFELRTVVGRSDWPTPVTSSVLAELTFRPIWKVPRSIARVELLRLVQRDPGYLARNGFRVFRDSAGMSDPVNPDSVRWAAISPEALPFQFVQEPGPENPLGGVKFVLHTPYGVHLHDTPAQALFARQRRAFSHGCVRVEGAERLVSYLLPDWPADSIASAMAEGRERPVTLPSPIPVYLVYWTAWPESDGLIAFRDDVYRVDGKRAGPSPHPH